MLSIIDSVMYPFLTQPPRKQRRVPPPLKSSTLTHPYASISAWASTVHPGSPAPCSPVRRPSTASSRRRASLSRAPSASQRTPVSATGEYQSDLTAVGYTSLFVYFDKTPTTPSPFKSRNGNTAGVPTPLTSTVFGNIPIPPVPPLPAQSTSPKPAKRAGLSRFRSLSILRSKKSKHAAQLGIVSSPVKSPKVESSAIAHRKRAKYTGKKASAKPPAPSLANELALLQFMEGGTVNDNVNRLMGERAKAAGRGAQNRPGVEGVYRDAKGGIWYDADEEMEYAHLLGPEDNEREGEDQNEALVDKMEDDFVVLIGPVVKAASPNTNVHYPSTPTSNGSTRSSPVSSRMFAAHPKQALLALPCRPRRNLRRPSLSKAYAHLSNTPAYLIDIDAFAPRSPNNTRTRGSSVPDKKHRPRPAPLQLTSSQSAHARANAKVALVTLNAGKSVKGPVSPLKTPAPVTGLSPSSLDRARREFVEDSFQPTI